MLNLIRIFVAQAIRSGSACLRAAIMFVARALDGEIYTWQQFQQYYGTRATIMWQQAEQLPLPHGQCFHHADQTSSLSPAPAPTPANKSPELADPFLAQEPIHATTVVPSSGAPQPTDRDLARGILPAVAQGPSPQLAAPCPAPKAIQAATAVASSGAPQPTDQDIALALPTAQPTSQIMGAQGLASYEAAERTPTTIVWEPHNVPQPSTVDIQGHVEAQGQGYLHGHDKSHFVPEPIPAPTVALSGGAPQPTDQDIPHQLLAVNPVPEVALALRVVLSLDALNALPLIAGIGGKIACRKMRELRQGALATQQFTVDLTHGDWPWKHVLRAASETNRQIIVGEGITSFTFRLIPNTRDANYKHVDSGERHVFEIHRTDGSVCHIHYHKKGDMDPPYVLPPRHILGNILATAPGIPHVM